MAPLPWVGAETFEITWLGELGDGEAGDTFYLYLGGRRDGVETSK